MVVNFVVPDLLQSCHCKKNNWGEPERAPHWREACLFNTIFCNRTSFRKRVKILNQRLTKNRYQARDAMQYFVVYFVTCGIETTRIL